MTSRPGGLETSSEFELGNRHCGWVTVSSRRVQGWRSSLIGQQMSIIAQIRSDNQNFRSQSVGSGGLKKGVCDRSIVSDSSTFPRPRAARRPPSATTRPPRDSVKLPRADHHKLQLGAATAAATTIAALLYPPPTVPRTECAPYRSGFRRLSRSATRRHARRLAGWSSDADSGRRISSQLSNPPSWKDYLVLQLHFVRRNVPSSPVGHLPLVLPPSVLHVPNKRDQMRPAPLP